MTQVRVPHFTNGNNTNISCVFLDSSSDDESIPEEILSPDKEYNYPQDHVVKMLPEQLIKPPIRDSSMATSANKLTKYPERERERERERARPPQNLPPLVSQSLQELNMKTLSIN